MSLFVSTNYDLNEKEILTQLLGAKQANIIGTQWALKNSRLLESADKYLKRGAAQHRAGILISHPAATGSNLGIPKKCSLDVAEIYGQHCLEQRTEA